MNQSNRNETLRILSRFYREYLSHYKIKFFTCCLLILFFTILLLTPPFLISLLIDTAIAEGDLTKVWLYSGGIMTVFILVGVNDKLQGMLGLSVAQQVTYDLRNALYAHLQKMTFSFYDNQQTGELLSRIIDDLNIVEQSLYNIPRTLIRNTVTVILAVSLGGYLLRATPSVAIACFAVFPGVFFVYVFFYRRLMKAARKVQKKKATLASQAETAISGIRIVQAFGQEDYEINRFNKENVGHFYSRMGVISYRTSMMPWTLGLMGLSLAIAAAYGGYQVVEGPLKIGALAGFIMYLQRFLGPLQTLANISDPASRFMAGISRFFAYMDIEPEIQDRKNAVKLKKVSGKVEFQDVWFKYEDEDILRGISFKAEPNQTIALVGPSGSGKTTITRLIPRFYEPHSGSILIDGYRLKDVTLRSLRANIGIVMQDQHLITGSLKLNICYGRPDATEEDIIEAAKKANVDSFVRDLPNGYDTQVGERGAKLSEGQAQRVAIARAILKDAPILILDEATSSVDSETEKLIQQALESLMIEKTAFIIAHRLSTIREADKIIFVEGGRIMEVGTHDELMEKDGKYAYFHDIQFRNAISS
ncbi:MAG: ABC transporter ATP-binding protein [Lentisphaeria bacterium]